MSYSKSYPLQFTGHGTEYFKIWIVNIVLTLMTLGIYSAWAKVRTARWFYGHTLLDGQVFSYLATPIQILKGRMIALVLVALYYAANFLSPLLAAVLLIGFFLLTPWTVINSLRFRARHSAYRGLRFDFTGGLKEAAGIYLLLPLATLLTLGLAFPYVAYRQVKFIAGNTVYGETRAQYGGTAKPFFGAYWPSLALMLLPFGLFAYGYFQMVQLSASGMPKNAVIAAVAGIFGLGAITFYLALFFVVALIQARTANLYYNHAAIGPVSFVSNQRARDLIWIYFSNLILIALTLGVFIPWAKVRLARYRAAHLNLRGPDDLDGFVAGQQKTDAATGAEIADVFDVNVGIA